MTHDKYDASPVVTTSVAEHSITIYVNCLLCFDNCEIVTFKAWYRLSCVKVLLNLNQPFPILPTIWGWIGKIVRHLSSYWRRVTSLMWTVPSTLNQASTWLQNQRGNGLMQTRLEMTMWRAYLYVCRVWRLSDVVCRSVYETSSSAHHW